MNAGKIAIAVVGIVVIVTMAAVLLDHSPNTGDDRTDVIFLMGQSNAAYLSWADASTAEPVPEVGTAFYYGVSAKPANFNYPASECRIWPMSDDDGARIGDKWPAIASAYVGKTGRHVVLAQIAEPGASIQLFSPTDNGRLWVASSQRATEVIEAMEKAHMSIGQIHVVWIQGEADRYMEASEYESRLIQIGTAISNGGLGCEVDMPIWVSLTRGTGGSVEAQKEITSERPGMFSMATTLASTFTVDNGLLRDDWTHYTQEGNNVLGTAIGEAVGESAVKIEKSDKAIWGFIGVGVLAMLLFAVAAIFRRD